MLPIALFAMLHLNQSPDTIGVRDALRTSIAAIEAKVAEQNGWIHTSEHVVVDVPSFLEVIGVDTARADRWRSIVDGIGQRASEHEQTCASAYNGFCPHLSAVKLSRVGNQLDLVVGVSYLMARYGPTGKPRARTVYFEMHVILIRTANSYRIDRISYGKMT